MASQFKVYQYTNDQGQVIPILIKAVNGDAINAGGVVGNVPFHIKRGKLRHIDLVCTTTNPPKRLRIPCCLTSNTKWTQITPFAVNIGGLVYNLAGRVGEKRF